MFWRFGMLASVLLRWPRRAIAWQVDSLDFLPPCGDQNRSDQVDFPKSLQDRQAPTRTKMTVNHTSYQTLPFPDQIPLVLQWMADIGHKVNDADKFKNDISADRGRAMKRANVTGIATKTSSSLPAAIVNDYPRFLGYVIMERAFLAYLKACDAVRTVNAME